MTTCVTFPFRVQPKAACPTKGFRFRFKDKRTLSFPCVRAKESAKALQPDAFAFPRSATSFPRNFAMRLINCRGTGSESGKRIVRLLTSYVASSCLNAATRGSVAG